MLICGCLLFLLAILFWCLAICVIGDWRCIVDDCLFGLFDWFMVAVTIVVLWVGCL